MRSEGYGSRSVCLYVCLCVCVSTYSRATGTKPAHDGPAAPEKCVTQSPPVHQGAESTPSPFHCIGCDGVPVAVVLLHQISHHLFTKEQRDANTSGLMHAFCHQNMNVNIIQTAIFLSHYLTCCSFVICFIQLFSYVMSVLYPECLIRLIMDFHSIYFEEVREFTNSSVPCLIFSLSVWHTGWEEDVGTG